MSFCLPEMAPIKQWAPAMPMNRIQLQSGVSSLGCFSRYGTAATLDRTGFSGGVRCWSELDQVDRNVRNFPTRSFAGGAAKGGNWCRGRLSTPQDIFCGWV